MTDAPNAISLSEIPEEPTAYRVWWEHHSAKLTSSKPPPKEFRDFQSEAEAVGFKRSQRAVFPHSVFCIEPVYVTSTKQKRSGNRRARR